MSLPSTGTNQMVKRPEPTGIPFGDILKTAGRNQGKQKL